MYETLQAHFYWPGLELECYETVRSCVECTRERVRIYENKGYLKMFTPEVPLQEVAMDLLGPLVKTSRGNEFLLAILDRFSKLTKA